MALDFHIAKDAEEASRSKPVASFDELHHQLAFHREKLPHGLFPLFARMKDFYGDARYRPEELEQLSNELTEIIRFFDNNHPLTDQISLIQSACEKAMGDNVSLWVFGD